MFNDIEELRTQIRTFNLYRLEEQLVSLAKPSIRMTHSQSDDAAILLVLVKVDAGDTRHAR